MFWALVLPLRLGASNQRLPYTAVIVDSIYGRSQLQNSGKRVWRDITRQDTLGSNDFIRLEPGAHLRLLWPDSSALYIRQNSRVLVSNSGSQSTPFASRHITIFEGEVFFVVKENDPDRFIRYDTKIYSPSSAFSTTAGSFSVRAGDRFSALSVVNGVVAARNIDSPGTPSIPAGYRIRLAPDSAPSNPEALIDSKLDSLKVWVPADIVEREIMLSIRKARRNYAIISGRYENKITFVPLTDSSSYRGPWNPAERIASMLSEKVARSFPGLTVEYVDGIPDNPQAIAGQNKSRFLAYGELSRFDISQRAEVSASADEYNEYRTAGVEISLKMLDLSRDTIAASATAQGQISGANEEQNSFETIHTHNFDLNDSLFTNSILGKALIQALEQCEAMITKGIQKQARY